MQKVSYKLKAILVDDEHRCLKTLSLLLEQNCKEVEIVALCDSGKLGLEAIKMYQPDIVFLDVDMPIMNGFEFLKQVEKIDFDVIFTTAYDQFAVEAFRICALDYLKKPIDLEHLKSAIEKIFIYGKKRFSSQQIQFILNHLGNIEEKKFNKIIVPTTKSILLVDFSQIIYCESDGNFSKVILKDGKQIHASKPLISFEESLCNYHFFRVHNQYIINIYEINEYIKTDGCFLKMSDGSRIRISRTKKDKILDLINCIADK